MNHFPLFRIRSWKDRIRCMSFYLQYIPRNMHTVFALLCFVVVIHWLIFPYPSGLLHWHCGNLTIAPVPAKQPWWIWINTSCEFIMNDCITTTKQSTTKPCAYFLGYTVHTAADRLNISIKKQSCTSFNNVVCTVLSSLYPLCGGSFFPTFNTLRPRQNDLYFPDGICECIFLNGTYEFKIRFHCNLSLMIQLTIYQYSCIGSENGLALVRRQAIVWINDDG